MQQLCASSWRITRFFTCCCNFKTNTFFSHLVYLISLSLVGFGILKALKPRTDSFTPSIIDLLYTSVSVATVSSMSVVEMEVFSNAQLIFIMILMFAGGEVFTSMAVLHLKAFKMSRTQFSSSKPPANSYDQIGSSEVEGPDQPGSDSFLKYDSIKFLGFVVLGYLVVIQILGIVSCLVYLALVSSAENVLRMKGIKTSTFAVFVIVSSFSNCGFIPTNENMVVFRKNSGLLLIIIPQILLGNTLFPCALRLFIWVLGRKFSKVEAEYLLKNQIEYQKLIPTLNSWLLTATVLGFIFVGFVLFSSLEWNTEALHGLNTYQKVISIIFQCTNARHSGETVLDLSALAPAILVFFIIMMYLPPHTSFLPVLETEKDDESKTEGKEKKKRNRVVENILLSNLSYLALVIVLICITERKSIKQDPLNFSVINITLEVISAYGNVGFTTGYSCNGADPKCVEKNYGFSGRWSDEGKFIIIIVMLLGRLKQFNINGGKAWKIL